MDLRTFWGNSEQLAELVLNLIRVGEVTSVNPSAYTARVRFEDRENIESYDLRVLARTSLEDKHYHMPDVGENVLCLFLPTGVEAGFVVGAYYPGPLARPASSVDVKVIEFRDGARVEYDRDKHRLLADLGETKITADRSMILLESNGSSIKIDASGVAITGPSHTHNGINVGDDHVHTGVEPGGANTGGPQ